MDIKALIFDLDNTLIDRDAAMALWLQHFYAEINGFELPSAELTSLMKADQSGRGTRREFWSYLIEKWSLNLSESELQQKLNQELYKFIQKDPAVHSMLKSLSEFYPLYLVSNGSSDNQRHKLAASGFEHFFTKFFISGELGNEKPSLFLSLTDSFDYPPHQCLMIGDDYEKDITGAAKAGFQTCYLGEGKADLNISNILDLEECLCQLH